MRIFKKITAVTLATALTITGGLMTPSVASAKSSNPSNPSQVIDIKNCGYNWVTVKIDGVTYASPESLLHQG